MVDWDERYSRGEQANDEPHPLIVTFVPKLAPGQALDVACGAGRHSVWLAQHGWQVTAVDNSRVGIEILRRRSREIGVSINACIADLERHEFPIEPGSYDLILICNYLQRDLFPSIKAATRVGGIVIAVIAMVDDDPNIKPMNPSFLLSPGELRATFEGWTLIHDFEGKPGNERGRATAEIIVQRNR
jgi:SAM-dependent methyltransferase